MRISVPLALVPTGLLQWFDAGPWRYWTIAWGAWIALALLVVLRLVADWHPGVKFRGRTIAPWLLWPSTFVIVAATTLLAFRWPMVFAGPLGNPDETHLAASALTYWHDPVPWRSVDMHTSGPIDAYFLWPAMLINGRIDYVGIRLAALVCHGVAALACYGTLRRLASEGVARLATLPFISFVAFTSFWDFTQYSSEQVSVCLISVAAWLVARACCDFNPTEAGRERWRLVSLAFAGLALGCLPFAKPQSVPLGIALGAIAFIAAWLRPAAAWRERGRRVGLLVGGAALPGALIALCLTIYGLWAQFHAAYIESNLLYSENNQAGRAEFQRNVVDNLVAPSEGYGAFLWGMLAVAGAAALAVGILRLRPRALLAAAWVLTVIALWSVVYPARAFPHYLQFTFAPLAWLGGLSFIATLRAAETSSPRRWFHTTQWSVAIAFFAITVAPQIFTRAQENHPVVGYLVEARHNSLHPVSARLRELARPGDTLTVWGWFSELHVESGLPQGTREAHFFREIDPTYMRDFYRQRFLRDIRRHPPEFIVDAVCPGSFGFAFRDTTGLETFPEFNDFVGKNYRFAEDIGGYHLYVRRDR